MPSSLMCLRAGFRQLSFAALLTYASMERCQNENHSQYRHECGGLCRSERWQSRLADETVRSKGLLRSTKVFSRHRRQNSWSQDIRHECEDGREFSVRMMCTMCSLATLSLHPSLQVCNLLRSRSASLSDAPASKLARTFGLWAEVRSLDRSSMRARLTSSSSPLCRRSSAKAFPLFHRGIVRCHCGCGLCNDFPTALFNSSTTYGNRAAKASKTQGGDNPQISEGEAVFGKVGVGGLDAEGAEHGDDLAAMEGGMVDGMKNDLPARDTEVSAIGHDGGKFGG